MTPSSTAPIFWITLPTVGTVGYKYIVGFTDLCVLDESYLFISQVVEFIDGGVDVGFQFVAFVCPEIAVALVCGFGEFLFGVHQVREPDDR